MDFLYVGDVQIAHSGFMKSFAQVIQGCDHTDALIYDS